MKNTSQALPKRIPGVWRTWLTLALFLFLVSPSVINYAPYRMAWDDMYLLHRAICLNHGVYHVDIAAMRRCYSILSKSPIMTFLTLPWGFAGGTETGIGLALVTLAILNWLIILVVCTSASSMRASPLGLLLAGACVYLNPFVKGYGGSFLADILVSWTIAAALLLVPLEAQAQTPQSRWQDIVRGLLWALLLNVGVLSKTTFGFFLIILAPLAVLYRWRRCGMRSALTTSGAALLGSLPAILLWLSFWRNFLSHAVASSFGEFARFYSVEGLGPWGYIKGYFVQSGASVIPLGILILYFLWTVKAQKRDRLALLAPVLLIVGYVILCTLSQAHDYRYLMPAMIALPVALAAARNGATDPMARGAAAVVSALLAGVLASIPMIARPDLTFVRYASSILDRFGRPGTSILLATDHPHLNIETFLLAQQIAGKRFRKSQIDTLVYDYVRNRSLAWSCGRMDEADIVLFNRPPLSSDPPWANKFAGEFRDHAIRRGSLVESDEYLDVFRLGTGKQASAIVTLTEPTGRVVTASPAHERILPGASRARNLKP